jgi:glycine cleavage system H protein
MSNRKCPFLETKTVTFCKAYPVKMIPLDRVSSLNSLCTTHNFDECSLYDEVNRPKEQAEDIRGVALNPDYYYHPRHLWIVPSRDGEGNARVGIDDLAARLIGRIDRTSVPSPGMPTKENGVCFLLHSGERTARLVAPSNGTIKAVNPAVAADPSLLNRDPYSGGWIFSMRVRADALSGLYHGKTARRWFEAEVARLQLAFGDDLGETQTDGGQALADLSGRLNNEQWEKVVRQFLG